MEQTELQLRHPKTGEPCDCTVWVSSRHTAQGAASISWRAELRIQGQLTQAIGPRNTELMEGALLLPPDVLAKTLMERALA